jgi:maltokinase
VISLAAAIAAANAADLLPDRSQARSGDLHEPCELVDSLDAGNGAYLALVRTGARTIVVPGQLTDTGFHRAPVSEAILNTESSGNFSIQHINSLAPNQSTDNHSTEHSITVDQSNDSVIVNNTIMLKWQINATTSPAPSRLRALSKQPVTPLPIATIEWIDPNTAEVLTLATATEFIPDSRDGWEWAVDLVRSYAQGSGVDAITPFARIGQMTGEMHVALARTVTSNTDDADIKELHHDRIQEFLNSALADLTTACEIVDGPEGERLRARQAAIRERLNPLTTVDHTPAINTHGDFHVGQIIESPAGEYYIVDFDGSPIASPLERLAKQPAARDVASMLASIDHVARVVNYRTEGLEPQASLIWAAHAQETFLLEYKDVLRREGLITILDERLIEPFMLHQELREYIYSVRHLPHWRYVPDSVITSMFPEASQNEGAI